jgi:hypothetical protein
MSTVTLPEPAEEPYHVFGIRMKWFVVAQIGLAGTFSGLTSSIYFPCLKTITKVINPCSREISFGARRPLLISRNKL